MKLGLNEAELQTTWTAIESALRPIALTDAGATEVASAFYDVAWVALGSPHRTYEEAAAADECFAVSWRGAGALVARIRDRGESYLEDFLYNAESGRISPRVRAVMRSLGLRPVI